MTFRSSFADRLRAFMERAFAPSRRLSPGQVELSGMRVMQRLRQEPMWESLAPLASEAPETSALRRKPRFPSVPVASAFRRKSRTRWMPLAAAIVLAVAVGTAVVWRPADPALYRVVEGDARVGDTIRSNGGAGAVLSLSDGSRIEMRSHSELSLERATDGVRIRLTSGGIIVNAAKQRTGHLYVQTKDMTVSVVGTVFVVSADNDGSRVAVIEGEVRVQQGATETKLRPGERVASSPMAETFSVASELAWSRRAESLVALLQQQSAAEQRPSAAASPLPKEPSVAFEVVSIRPTESPAVPGRGGGGGGGAARRTRNPRGDNPCSLPMEPQIDARRFDASNATVVQLIAWAYATRCVGDDGSNVVFDVPEWAKKDGFDIQALRSEGPPDFTSSTLSGVQATHVPGARLQRMLQTMLAERFKLAMRRETREMSVYVLNLAKGGPKYTATRPARQSVQDVTAVAGSRDEGRAVNPELSVWKEGDDLCCDSGGPASIDGRRKPVSYVTGLLEYFLGRPILDRTGLTGEFNFFLNFAPINRPGAPPVRATEGPLPTRSVFDVLQDVGLELKPGREKVDVWVVERVERPSEN